MILVNVWAFNKICLTYEHVINREFALLKIFVRTGHFEHFLAVQVTNRLRIQGD